MKKNDMMTIVGLILGIILLIWGMASGGTSLKIFWDVPSIAITIGGSFCAMLVNYPMSEFKRLGKVMAQSFKENKVSNIEIINQFSMISKKARREGLLALEDEIDKIEDAFLKKGLQMVVDGIEPETIRDIMELEIDEMEKRHKNGADMLKTWGGYAPAFGMVGTLIGLIQMLAYLSDASKIASGMAKALITTYYGSLAAYLIFNPMSAKLMYKSEVESTNKEMMLEGILAVQAGVNPRIVEDKLVTYLSPEEKKEFYKIKTQNNEVAENV